MEVRTYPVEGLKLIIPRVFHDQRGFFLESYNRRVFHEAGIECEFVQDNHSRSTYNTLRGLHYQIHRVQAKLVRAVQGTIFDVAVDMRPDSPTHGQWVGEVLSAENKHQLFVPAGFAHGFQVLSDTAEVLYKCSDFYSPKDERGIMWNDPELNIDWPVKEPPVLSEKDQHYPGYRDAGWD